LTTYVSSVLLSVITQSNYHATTSFAKAACQN
jgi:hypothetical protein